MRGYTFRQLFIGTGIAAIFSPRYHSRACHPHHPCSTGLCVNLKRGRAIEVISADRGPGTQIVISELLRGCISVSRGICHSRGETVLRTRL